MVVTVAQQEQAERWDTAGMLLAMHKMDAAQYCRCLPSSNKDDTSVDSVL